MIVSDYKVMQSHHSKCMFRTMDGNERSLDNRNTPLQYLLLKQSLKRHTSDGLGNVRYNNKIDPETFTFSLHFHLVLVVVCDVYHSG